MSTREDLRLVGHLTFVKKVPSDPQHPLYKMGLAVDRGKGKDSVYYTVELSGRYAEWMEKTVQYLKPGRVLMVSGTPDFRIYTPREPGAGPKVERLLTPSSYPEMLDSAGN